MDKIAVKDSKRENLVKTLFLWILFGGCALVIMLYTAVHKTVVIANVPGEESIEELPMAGESGTGRKLLFREQSTEGKTVYIPLEKGQKAEDVAIENHYMERELRIYIYNSNASFYEENAITGAVDELVKAGFCETWKEGVVLKLSMTGIYEYVSMLESDVLAITCCAPKELYDHIVVIDPAGGGENYGLTVEGKAEKDIALQVAKVLQRQMEETDDKLYFTRLSDVDVADEERAELAREVQADIYISLGVAADTEHPENYGIRASYNETYFIPDFGNVQLADILARNVTIASSNRAVGLFALQGEDESTGVLSLVDIPAARIELGNLANEQERQLLGQDEYLENLAEGLANAIAEVYTE